MDAVWGSYLAADEAGSRVDAYRGYLRPVLEGGLCGNLEVIQGATATRVLLDGNSSAVGVAYQKGPDGDPEVLRCCRTEICCVLCSDPTCL